MRRSYGRGNISLLMVGALVFLTAIYAHALPVVTFDQEINGGTLSYDGIGGSLVGSNILFDFIVGSSTPLQNGTQLACQECVLNFETGPNLTESPFYTWDGGGSYVVTGTAKDGATEVASGTLIEGEWASPVLGFKSPGKISITGFGSDDKNDDLAGFFGLSLFNFVFSNSQLGLGAVFAPNGGFTADVRQADLTNTAVPEPDSMLMLGGALAALGFWGRRKYAQSRA